MTLGSALEFDTMSIRDERPRWRTLATIGLVLPGIPSGYRLYGSDDDGFQASSLRIDPDIPVPRLWLRDGVASRFPVCG